MLVMHRGRRRADRVNNTFFAVNADMRPGSEVVLVSFLRLMHLGIAFLLAVLGRPRSRDDGGINNRAGGDANALAIQILVHGICRIALSIYLQFYAGRARLGNLIRGSLGCSKLLILFGGRGRNRTYNLSVKRGKLTICTELHLVA